MAMAPEPWCLGRRGPTLKGKVKVTSKRFLCRRDLVRLGLSGTFLDPMGTLCVKLDTGPRGQNSHFCLGEP